MMTNWFVLNENSSMMTRFENQIWIDVDHSNDVKQVNMDGKFWYVHNDQSDPMTYVHNLRKRKVYVDEFCSQTYDWIRELFVDEILNCNVE